MRILVYKTIVLLFLIHIVFPVSSFSNTSDLFKKEFTRTIKKEFPITADGNVNMSNRYGKVEIKTWDQNQVKAEVTITVNASSEEKADEVFDRIQVEFSNGSDYVSGETTIESSKKGWMSSWWGSSSNSDFSIDYEVYMPTTCNLELSNKYGHSTVEKIGGKAKVIAKYGDVRMDGVAKDLHLDIGYGNATIESSRDADVLIKYGTLRLESAQDVDLESKYSKIYISNAADLETISKYDTYRLGKIHDFRNQGKYDDVEIDAANTINTVCRYSDFEVQSLQKKGTFHMEYGGLKVGNLSNAFTKLEVDAKYTDVKVGIEKGGHYELDILTNYAGIRYPEGADIHYDVENGSSHELKGNVGGKGSNNLVHIRSSYGSVKIW